MSNIVLLPDAKLINGDAVEEIRNFESESIDFTVFSPPFPELYTYSNDERDMGNCKDYQEFKQHFSYLPDELFRVTKQGRNVAIHCMDIPVQKGKHGYIGLRDFSGLLVEMMEQAGFIYHSRITIWKNPVTEMQRTKALGLLHKQVKKDSTMSRVGIPDYVLIFRKDGDRNNPVKCKITVDEWQEIASPVWPDKALHEYGQVDLINTIEFLKTELIKATGQNQAPLKWLEKIWMDIDYGKTLNAAIAREDADEKHICPLQLETIERLNTLYSNEGDTVLTTFGGVGSEPYQSLRMKRKAVAIELKKTYFDIMVKNCNRAIAMNQQLAMNL